MLWLIHLILTLFLYTLSNDSEEGKKKRKKQNSRSSEYIAFFMVSRKKERSKVGETYRTLCRFCVNVFGFMFVFINYFLWFTIFLALKSSHVVAQEFVKSPTLIWKKGKRSPLSLLFFLLWRAIALELESTEMERALFCYFSKILHKSDLLKIIHSKFFRYTSFIARVAQVTKLKIVYKK